MDLDEMYAERPPNRATVDAEKERLLAVQDSLGWRMKRAEYRYRRTVPGDDYMLLRIDGRAFHSYTRGLQRPYDFDLMDAMDATMVALCAEIDGARVGYCQSDEISIVVCNWNVLPDGQVKRITPWLGGVEAKVLSVSASLATSVFNQKRLEQFAAPGAQFDARLWTFSPQEWFEVQNYLLWRQLDCAKNSVTMAAQTLFSHRQLHRVNTDQKRALLAERGQPWEQMPDGFRQGRVAAREARREEVSYFDRRISQQVTTWVDRSPFVARAAPGIGDWVWSHIPKKEDW